MDRNFILAFLLSSMVIFGYFSIYPPEPAAQKDKVEQVAKVEAVKTATQEASAVKVEPVDAVQEASRQLVTVETPLYKAVIDTKNGVLKSLLLKEYNYAGPAHMQVTAWISSIFSDESPAPKTYAEGRLVEMVGDAKDGLYPWQLDLQKGRAENVYFTADKEFLNVTTGAQSIVLTGVNAEGLQIVKKITFDPASYIMQLDITIVNQNSGSVAVSPVLKFGVGPETVEADRNVLPKNSATYIIGEFDTYDSDDLEEGVSFAETKWAVVMNTYFAQGVMSLEGALLQGNFAKVATVFNEDEAFIPSLEITKDAKTLASGEIFQMGFKNYLGPKRNKELEAFDVTFPASLDLGFLEALAHPLLALLRWLQSHVNNWGIAIILLTIIVRVGMFPLALKGMRSMKRMGHLGPRMKHLRAKHKKDKERMNKEIMLLYKKNKINPIGGCLPLLMQVPIFIALYQALMPAIELRHSDFAFWMDNLSAPDYTLILPILMGASMFVQQKITPQPNMEPIQQKMMMWMPVVLVVFFLDMPSGLVLYWVASNIFTIFQQLFFNRIKEAEIKH